MSPMGRVAPRKARARERMQEVVAVIGRVAERDVRSEVVVSRPEMVTWEDLKRGSPSERRADVSAGVTNEVM